MAPVVFEAYGTQHFGALGAALCIGWVLVRNGMRLPPHQATKLGILIAFPVAGVVLTGMLIEVLNGTFDYLTDLPLFLCRLLGLAMPIVMATKSRYWSGIFYFWIMAGTLQALITPDLSEGFPRFWYFRYWILHTGLVIASIYSVVVYQLYPGWKDFFRAVVFTQLYLISVHLLNYVLGSNYSYTMQRPEGGSLLDLFGPWPWYILGGEFLMFALFFLVMLPLRWLRLSIQPVEE